VKMLIFRRDFLPQRNHGSTLTKRHSREPKPKSKQKKLVVEKRVDFFALTGKMLECIPHEV
jgi:hypothetical protein